MSTIKVAVRVRPLDEGKKEAWAKGFELASSGRRITLGTTAYDPEVTLPPHSTQQDVFEHCVPILDSVLNGCNGTIMVYGQTGTGKTHTMMGNDRAPGVVFQCINNLLAQLQDATRNGRQVGLSLSMMEIYNERITDMLAKSANNDVTLCNGFPQKRTEVSITKLDDAEKHVMKGLSSRKVEKTDMNERSSRSHVIVMLDFIEKIGDKVQTAHLFLVDLAGSECLKKSGATGKVANEACMINKSLLALKNVILKLSEVKDETQRGHVPYRDSKLTLMLQDSIGGTARTMLIACISPNGRDLDETKSTLEYASKARQVKNLANTEKEKMLVKIKGLEAELQKSQNRLSDKLHEKGGYFVSKSEHAENLELKERYIEKENEVAFLLEEMKAHKGQAKVADSQIQLFKDMYHDQAKKTEEKVREFEEHQKSFQSTVQKLRSEFTRNMKDVHEAIGHDYAAANAQIDSAVESLEHFKMESQADFQKRVHGLLTAMMKDVKTFTTACVKNSKKIEKSLQEQETRHRKALLTSVAAKHKEVLALLKGVEQDIGQMPCVDVSEELAWTNVEAPSLLNRIDAKADTEHIVSDFVVGVQEHVKAVRVAPSGVIATASQEALSSVRSATTDAVALSLAPLANAPEAAPEVVVPRSASTSSDDKSTKATRNTAAAKRTRDPSVAAKSRRATTAPLAALQVNK